MSAGLWILCIFIGLLLLLLFLPLRVRVRQDTDLTVWVGLGPVGRQMVPPRKKKPAKPPKKAKKSAKKPPKPPKEQGGITLEKIRDGLQLADQALKGLKRLLRVRRFKLHIVFGGPDPMHTAMAYGGAAAVLSTIYPVLEQSFRVKETDIFVDADFAGQGSLLLETEIRATPAVALMVGLRLLLAYFKIKNKHEAGKGGTA